MTKISKKTDFTIWVIQWIGRVLSTLFFALWLLMVINSAIYGRQNRKVPWTTLEDIVMSVFFLAMLAGVIIAWYREWIGGLMLTIIGLVAIVGFMLTNAPHDYWVALIIGAPFLVSGILYLICWRRLGKLKIPQEHE